MGSVLFNFIFSFSVAFAAVPGVEKGSDWTLVTRSVGTMAGKIITSREIIINSFIEDKLYRSSKAKQIYKLSPNHSQFVQETTAVLLELSIAEEGLRFPVAEVEEPELKAQKRKFLEKIKSDKAWKRLDVEDQELSKALKSKMSAKKFIRFKVGTASLPISDEEALEYFNNNRFKFEKYPFEKFKKNIKSFLNKKRVDARLREWFEVLQIKYSIRNHIIEEKS